MTEKRRYGVGSLEEEIRRMVASHGPAQAVQKFASAEVQQLNEAAEQEEALEESLKEMLAEGDVYGSYKVTDMVATKKSKHSIIGGKAAVIMKIVKGKLEFTVRHDNGRIEHVDAKGLAKIVA